MKQEKQSFFFIQKIRRKSKILRICISSIAIMILIFFSSCSDDTSNENSSMPTEGLVVFLAFEGNADDLSGNGNHGSLSGNAETSGTLVLGNNAEDALKLPSSVMNGLVDFTFAAWLKINTFRNESHELISGANSSEDNVLIIWYREETDEWVMGINDGSSEFDSDMRIEDGNWHHVVITRSGASALLYLDGMQIGSAISVGGDQLEIDTGGLVIGQDQDTLGGNFHVNDCWAGAMDNIRIYNRSLDENEVHTIADEIR